MALVNSKSPRLMIGWLQLCEGNVYDSQSWLVAFMSLQQSMVSSELTFLDRSAWEQHPESANTGSPWVNKQDVTHQESREECECKSFQRSEVEQK